eukprot:6225444-Amphidinium_carterae.1
MLSGRSIPVASNGNDTAEGIVFRCRIRLEMQGRRGRETFVHGREVVPATARVDSWPGLRPQGEVSEYQLRALAAELRALCEAETHGER